MSKIIITSRGNNKDSQFDKRCGRAAWFCIYNDQNDEITYIENQHIEKENAGLGVVDEFINLGVDKIISGDFGTKVQNRLKNENIQMVMIENKNYTIDDIVNLIKMNK